MELHKEIIDSAFFPESINRQTHNAPAAPAALQAVAYHAQRIAAFHHSNGWERLTFDFWHNGLGVVGALQGEHAGKVVLIKDLHIDPDGDLQSCFTHPGLKIQLEFLSGRVEPIVVVTGYRQTDQRSLPGRA